MYRLEELMLIMDQVLDTRKKRHIIGGVLMSVSLLFGGLALTIMTVKMEDTDDE